MEISRAATGLLAACASRVGAGGDVPVVRGGGQTAEPVEAVAPQAAAAVEQSEGVLPAAPDRSPAPSAARRRDGQPAAHARRQTGAAPPSDSAGHSTRPGAAAPPRAKIAATIPPPSIPETQASAPIEPPAPVLEELVVSAQSVIGLQMETAVTSETARLEDEVVARVTRDVRVGDRVAIPAGARAEGEVTLVERGGRVRERARLGVRFTSIVLADGTRLPIHTEAVFREGDSPGRESAAKIGGGAIGGAIIGGILGGAKGAAIGSTVGAGAGTAAVMAGGRNHATLSSGAPLTVRLEEPAAITVDR